ERLPPRHKGENGAGSLGWSGRQTVYVYARTLAHLFRQYVLGGHVDLKTAVTCADCGAQNLDIWYTGQTWGETLGATCYVHNQAWSEFEHATAEGSGDDGVPSRLLQGKELSSRCEKIDPAVPLGALSLLQGRESHQGSLTRATVDRSRQPNR